MTVSGCQSSPRLSVTPNTSSPRADSGSSPSGNPGPENIFGGFDSAVASPATSLDPHNPLEGPPADPFAGTPAEHWNSGASGIAAPAARAAGSFPAWRVEQAYAMTRKLLIAADLDKKTLLGGTPTAFENLLTPQQRAEFRAGLNKTGVDSKGQESSRSWLVSFFPGSAQLIGSVIKVHGAMSAKSVTEHGEHVLRVTVDYIFVYAIQPPHQPWDWMRVVAQESGSVEFGYWAQGRTPFDPWVLVAPFVAPADCASNDGYVHPSYPGSPPSSVRPSGKPVDPYAMNSAPPGPGTDCQATTGT
jgi:hypothetical protein